jgi:hypothetical protein
MLDAMQRWNNRELYWANVVELLTNTVLVLVPKVYGAVVGQGEAT